MQDGGRSKGDRAYRRVLVLVSALATRNVAAAACVGLPREAKSGLALRGSGLCSWRCCKGRSLACLLTFTRNVPLRPALDSRVGWHSLQLWAWALEVMVPHAINWNDWSSSIGTGGRHHMLCVPMPKQPCFDKRSPGVIIKKPATRPVWLLLGLTALLLVAMTRKAYGSAFPR
jgi:hypothetical protein